MNKKLSNVPSAGTTDEQRPAADDSRSASVEASPMLADAVQGGNKLIAGFMDIKVCEWQGLLAICDNDGEVDLMECEFYSPYSDWEQLIPAWAKFCDKSLEFLPSLKNKVGFEKEVRFYVVQKGKFEKAIHSNNCSQAFEILVESIKWYNAENNKSN